jgi:sRNA-binding protein|tara:strand:+ start:11871 stop:12254 length:384 start_codon:yes stop_codon:yes gene_type:complete
MCGGGRERKARKRAERDAQRAREEAARREQEAIARAEEQAQRMLEQQRKSYETMQAMIPKPPKVPKARPASTTTEMTDGVKVKRPSEDVPGGVKLKKPKKRERRGRSSLLIGLAPGVRGAGRNPNIN